MVATWIMNSVSKKIAQSLLFMSTAESIWKNILARFKQDDAPRVFEIEQRLGTLEQGSMDVSSFYTELMTLWEEYKNYIELPVCMCGRCECNAAALWESLQQRSRVMKFLMGLNEAFEPTRRHILMMKPIPSLEDYNNTIVLASVRFVPTVVSLVMSFRKCFKLHGYPPGHKFHIAPDNNSLSAVSWPESESQLNTDQFQTLLQQLQSHVKPPESHVPVQRASITEGGHMAAESSAGIVSFPSS
ncbi:unnamed protein product [Microthlaspi erraticum]|uniref:Uncharacterized protein n=1 Tax=Microthlaspi erraticum TaxID=1685480 RepID=A0A6D2HZH7_9BRAS|nr:unnamed protein product [Microthlaspi erraticum]